MFPEGSKQCFDTAKRYKLDESFRSVCCTSPELRTPMLYILYAPRQPPTLVRLLRINTLLIYSLRCLASAVLMLTPWVGWDPAARGTLGGPRGGRALRARTGGRTRASRALGRARAARAHGAFGADRAEGPKGQRGIGIFPKAGQMEGYPTRKCT